MTSPHRIKTDLRLLLLTGFLGLGAGFSPAFSWAAPQTGVAMLGAPKYSADFTHFDYADPAAPKGGFLKIGVVGSFDSFNPFIVRGQSVVAPAFSLDRTGVIYESLMARSWDEPFSLYGLIAQTMDVAEDRRSVVFAINPEAKWSDGTPITADDVMFSYQTLREKGRPNHRTYYKKVSGVEILDARHIKFTFALDTVKLPNGKTEERVDREMPLIMGLMPVLPQHDWYFRDFNEPSLRLPLGSGPYRVTRFEAGRFVLLERNPNYWGQNLPTQRGLYNFDKIRFDFYRDDGIALQAFKAGAFDVRREQDPKKWATSYDDPATEKGLIVKGRFPHARTEPATGFALNTRREIFKDPVLREAVFYAFDFGWINKNLFHGLFKRTTSFFPNADLAVPLGTPPSTAEQDLLRRIKKTLPPQLFNDKILTQSVDIPTTDGTPESLRSNLLKAQEILRHGGYDWYKGRLHSPQDGNPVEFEILLADPNDEKIALSWSQGLKRLGITARVRTADSAQFQARLMNFDYDVVATRWVNSLSPGNEQMFFWGTAAAKQKGSRNYVGLQDPVIDALAMTIPSVKTREDLLTATHALDRLLLAGHYVVPFHHLGADHLAYWASRLAPPEGTGSGQSAMGPFLEAWFQPQPTPSPVVRTKRMDSVAAPANLTPYLNPRAPMPRVNVIDRPVSGTESDKVAPPDLRHIIPDPRPLR